MRSAAATDDEATAGATATTTPPQVDQEIQQRRPASRSAAATLRRGDLRPRTGDQPYVDVAIEGLDPAPRGKTYVVWLMLTDDKGYPLAPFTVAQNGTFSDRFPIPSALLPLVAARRSSSTSRSRR